MDNTMRILKQFLKVAAARLRLLVAVIALAGIGLLSQQLDAAVQGVGDVLPQQIFVDVPFGFGDDEQLVTLTAPSLPFSGGRLTITMDDGMGGETTSQEDLIVGGTGEFSGTTLADGTQIGTTVGSVTINSPTNTLPLIAADIIIGEEFNGHGLITVTDFNSTLIAEDDDLTIGEDGKGELRILNGAVVGAGEPNPTTGSTIEGFAYENGVTIIGDNRRDAALSSENFVSQGLVTIDGFGSKLETEDLTVARQGLGTIEISNQGLLRTRTTTIGEAANSIGKVTLTGQFTEWNNAETITIGNAGSGTLEVGDQALVVAQAINVGATMPDNLGSALLDLTGGTVISRTPIMNNDTIRGDGFINADLVINPDGVLSNSTAQVQTTPTITQTREFLQVSGPVTNTLGGLIQSEGGEMKFDALVTNGGDIVAREAIMRFNATPPEDSIADLINTGTLIAGGDVTITGDIENSGGQIATLEDTFVLLQGNLDFTSGVLTIISGDTPAPITVTGEADLGGAAFDISLTTAVATDEGPFELVQALGGIVPPSFPTAEIDGELYDLIVMGNTLVAQATGAAAVPVGADFNGDGIVNSLDLLIWENNYPIASGALKTMGDADGDGDVDGSDFFKIQTDFGVLPVPPIVASSVVPEPSTLVMAMLTLVVCPRRRVGR